MVRKMCCELNIASEIDLRSRGLTTFTMLLQSRRLFSIVHPGLKASLSSEGLIVASGPDVAHQGLAMRT